MNLKHKTDEHFQTTKILTWSRLNSGGSSSSVFPVQPGKYCFWSIMKMPFGKYEGTELNDCPAEYLDWLRGESWIDKFPLIEKYLDENSSAIDSELNAGN